MHQHLKPKNAMPGGSELSNVARVQIGALTALSGGATAWAITTFGRRMNYLLPDAGFHLAAIVGAGLAGFIVAHGLGRAGVRGLLMGLVSAIAATLLGAWIGAALLVPMPVFPMGVGIGVLGWMALLEAASADPMIVKLWGLAMLALHLNAQALRNTADPQDD